MGWYLPPLGPVLQALGVRLHGEATQQICCPVHEDRSPSARYYHEDQSVHCFVCGRSWNALSVVMAKFSYDRATAELWLAERFQGVETALDVKVTSMLHRAVFPKEALAVRLDFLETRVREHAPDMQTAVRWWMAIDVLRAELRDPTLLGAVAVRLTKLRARILGTTPGNGTSGCVPVGSAGVGGGS